MYQCSSAATNRPYDEQETMETRLKRRKRVHGSGGQRRLAFAGFTSCLRYVSFMPRRRLHVDGTCAISSFDIHLYLPTGQLEFKSVSKKDFESYVT